MNERPSRGRARREPDPQPGSGDIELHVEPDTSIPLVDIDVILRGGSIHDPVGREGLARLHARLLRRGTVRKKLASGHAIAARTADEIEEAIERLGASLSAEVTPSAVRFHASVIRRNVEPLFEILASLFTAPAFREDDLAFVRRETQAELLAQLDNDRWLASRALRHAVLGAHPYGRSVTGTERSLEAITRRDIRAHHATRLRAGNLLVGFSGDITAAQARGLVEAHLADVPAGASLDEAPPDPAPPRGLRIVLIDKPDRTQTQLFLGTTGVRVAEPAYYPLLLANTVFGGTFSARLVREVRSERGWSYSASSRLYADRARDLWVAYTHPSVTDARDCLALELDLFAQFVQGGVRKAEVAFAKAYLTGSHAFDRDTAAKRLEPRLDASLYGVPSSFFGRYLEHIAAVDAASASHAVRQRLGGATGKGTDLVVAILAPRALERALAALPGVTSIQVLPHTAIATL